MNEELDRVRKQISTLRNRAKVLREREVKRKRRLFQAKKRERLQSTLKTYGGRQAFIKEWGHGGWNDEYSHYSDLQGRRCCCVARIWNNLYGLECDELGVKCAKQIGRCLAPGRYDMDGVGLCTRHYKAHVEGRQCW